MATSRFVTHGGVRLHYLDSGGDDRGAPIVFVPGMTDVADDYLAVLDAFGRRTVVVDLRGHGRSSAPAFGYSLDDLSGDVGAVVDDLTPGPVHLVTFSRGTSSALHWALRHPDRVRSVAIGDYPPAEVLLPTDVADRLLAMTWRGSPVSERVTAEAMLGTLADAKARSFWEPLAALAPPLLVVRSGTRGLLPDELWDRLRGTFPTASLVTYEDSPHDIFRPDRRRYPDLVREHVDRADAAVDF